MGETRWMWRCPRCDAVRRGRSPEHAALEAMHHVWGRHGRFALPKDVLAEVKEEPAPARAAEEEGAGDAVG